jgi:hypothetical protein
VPPMGAIMRNKANFGGSFKFEVSSVKRREPPPALGIGDYFAPLAMTWSGGDARPSIRSRAGSTKRDPNAKKRVWEPGNACRRHYERGTQRAKQSQFRRAGRPEPQAHCAKQSQFGEPDGLGGLGVGGTNKANRPVGGIEGCRPSGPPPARG